MEDKENKDTENQSLPAEDQENVQGTPELSDQQEPPAKEEESDPPEEDAKPDGKGEATENVEEPKGEETDSVTGAVDPEGNKPTDEPEEQEEAVKEEPVPEAKEVTQEAETSEEAEKSVEESSEATEKQAAGESKGETTDDDGESEDEDHTDEELKLLESLELEHASKEELYEDLKKFSNVENMRVVDKALKEIRPHYDKIYDQEQQTALQAFIAEGNDESDFDYKGDETDQQFFFTHNKLRDKKQAYFSQLHKAKDANLQKRNSMLEQLREIVDGEESTTSLNALKALQAEWKSIGPVPGQHAKSLWASYNALLDRFYDNRSIYFELKELDRKKNLEAKLELCVRAEALDKIENIKDAIFELNELHEEFKHIGPVPKEEQEPLWQRFKGASDTIYAKRKDYFEHLKKDLQENMDKKLALGDQAEAFAGFESDRITEWNKKTKEVLELQKQWDAIGGIPREQAKKVNKHFWGNFKTFFRNKNAFFKTLEGQREENLKKKQELVVQAEALKESEDWNKTANELKALQTKWRDIGPVPEKHRNEAYRQFKAACDHFFERKRAKGQEHNKEFEDNLKKKEEICSILEAYMNSDAIDLEQVYDLMDQYAQIGFVPRNAIKKIHDRYDKVTNELINLEELSDEQQAEIKMQVKVSKLKNSPHGNQKLHRKENAIKRKMSTIQNDISTWKTNLDFFAASKNAEQLKDEFQEKIEKAEEELEELKKQLDVLNHA